MEAEEGNREQVNEDLELPLALMGFICIAFGIGFGLDPIWLIPYGAALVIIDEAIDLFQWRRAQGLTNTQGVKS